jgi:SagB-type dehydrogenase family enzyme
MNTLTKMALGLIGHLKPARLEFDASKSKPLPAPVMSGGLPLMQALSARHSQREFKPTALSDQTLADLLWAATGVNRPALGGRTAPSAMNAQEVDVYVALQTGLYRYEPVAHVLHLAAATDVRRVTGYQDFVDTAPLDLVYVADHARMKLIPASQRVSFASMAAGAMAQNVYLYCASAGLATVARAWFDRAALSQYMGLENDQEILLTQTVGMP